jgi:hypothetical protein
VYLGAGGSQPAVWAFEPDSGNLTQMLRLPPGHSVYTIDLDTEAGIAAIGTRAGRIHLLRLDGEPSAEHEPPPARLQGADILSLRLVNSSLMASSDTIGRCLLWSLSSAEDPPRLLPSGAGPVCALCRLGDGDLAGLASAGQLLRWRLPQAQLLAAVRVPPPPEKTALVQLAWWPPANALAFVAADGSLVLHRPGDDSFSARPGHEGPAYALLACADRLLTIGFSDGQLNVWAPDQDPPIQRCPARPGIVAGAVLDDQERRLLLIDAGGTAATYCLGAGGLQLESTLQGRDYRAAAGTSVHALRSRRQRRRLETVDQLNEQAQRQIAAGQFEGLDLVYARLDDLGFKRLALGLQASQAAVQQDVIAELRARHALAATLPTNDGRARSSLHRYARLLEQTWQIPEAEQVYRLIGQLPADGRIARYAQLLSANQCVVEPDIPIPSVLEAAAIVGRPFVGRWLFRRIADSWPSGIDQLPAQTIVDKYEQVREEGGGALPPAQATQLWWLSRAASQHLETVILGDDAANSVPGLRLALQILDDGIQSILVRAILLEVTHDPADDLAKHHEAVKSTVCRLNAGWPAAQTWLNQVNSAARAAVQRLRNHARSRGTL